MKKIFPSNPTIAYFLHVVECKYILGKKGLCQGQSHPPSTRELPVNTKRKCQHKQEGKVRHRCHVSTAVCVYLVGVDCICVVKPNPAKIDAALWRRDEGKGEGMDDKLDPEWLKRRRK